MLPCLQLVASMLQLGVTEGDQLRSGPEQQDLDDEGGFVCLNCEPVLCVYLVWLVRIDSSSSA